ncbi:MULTISPECIES: hypothetical protein [unclassified Pseudomonas]|uniref:hypothetical protein n=1 Tax=unclassified Pseudomonas TaxID=196821 RepID=UPI000B130510|nr:MULTISPECIES: hypothetical protein [unclassified Pseudomonas]MBV7476166.1 hypothetical protein [Pseudomonas sp. PDM31]
MTINDFRPPSSIARIGHFLIKGPSMRYRLNSLPLKQKVIFCLAAYLFGVALAWLIDYY